MEHNSSLVTVNVRKHRVVIEDELSVIIFHNPECQQHCLENDAIITYLQDELFLAEGFIVKNDGEI
jgi:hypothetical protein